LSSFFLGGEEEGRETEHAMYRIKFHNVYSFINITNYNPIPQSSCPAP
jgi:hypothetical protein